MPHLLWREHGTDGFEQKLLVRKTVRMWLEKSARVMSLFVRMNILTSLFHLLRMADMLVLSAWEVSSWRAFPKRTCRNAMRITTNEQTTKCKLLTMSY
jgi:hypothetical protein